MHLVRPETHRFREVEKSHKIGKNHSKLSVFRCFFGGHVGLVACFLGKKKCSINHHQLFKGLRPRCGRAHAQALVSAVHGQNKCCSQHGPPVHPGHPAFLVNLWETSRSNMPFFSGGEGYESNKNLNSPCDLSELTGFGTMSLHLFHSYFIYFSPKP